MKKIIVITSCKYSKHHGHYNIANMEEIRNQIVVIDACLLCYQYSSYVHWHLSRMNKTTVNSHFLYCLSKVFSKGWVGSYCVWLMTASVNFKKK